LFVMTLTLRYVIRLAAAGEMEIVSCATALNDNP
jgi:hypothetical protein